MPTNPHPAQQLTLSFLPKMLVNICHGLVEKHHQAFGYSSLSTYLWHRDTNAFIAIHQDLFTFMYNATILWRFRNLSVVVAIIFIVLAIFVNGWIVLGLIPIFVLIRHLIKRMYVYCTLTSSLMLAFEIAANDYGGWVTQLPEVHATANNRLQRFVPESRTRFLDIYLPNRDTVTENDQQKFAAMIREDFEITQPDHIKRMEAIFV